MHAAYRCGVAGQGAMTGSKSKQAKKDAEYQTRYPVALAVCEQLERDGFGGRRVLEPSAGRGAFVSAAAEVFRPDELVWCDTDTSLMLPAHARRAEAYSGSVEMREGDFLTMSPEEHGLFDLIVGNPPNSDSERHLRKALSMLSESGHLAFLLRVSFLAGKDRCGGLWMEHPPEHVYPLDRRPTFKLGPWRRSKRTGYALFVFGRRDEAEFEPTIRWLRWSGYLKRFHNEIDRVERQKRVDKAGRAIVASEPHSEEVAPEGGDA